MVDGLSFKIFFSFVEICGICQIFKNVLFGASKGKALAGLYQTVWGSVGKGTCWEVPWREFNSLTHMVEKRINSLKLSFDFQMCAMT